MTTIYVENEPRQVDSNQNLLHVLLSTGYDVPYFCWHPALGSVGACRQCAVKQFRNEQDTTGKIVMACMTPVAEGTRLSIKDPEATEFRAAVIQGLMQNHPHDCPVCDEGGECHLQDMTVMTGHTTRQYRFPKRTFSNQYLGPLINHEMNRCIQCQRCVRFYRDYAGGNDLNAFRLRDTLYFGRCEDGVLENEFSGSLVEICPTGVFTDATLKRHYARKWDLQMAPSVCAHCSAGCNTSIGERYGTLRRVVNRYNHEVNGYFLCDRGRFGYEFVNSEQRIRQCLVNGQPSEESEAAEHVRTFLRDASCIGIGSPRASLESNFALREFVGADRFYAGVAEDEWLATVRAVDNLKNGPARVPSLDEIEHCDAVFVLGEDVTNVAPIMGLRLRQSVRQQPLQKANRANIPLWLDHAVRELLQDEKGPFFVATPFATKLDDVATEVMRAAPDDLARIGFAVAHVIDNDAPAVTDLPTELNALADRIAAALQSAASPLVVSGVGCRSMPVVEAAAQIAWALCKIGKQAKLAYCFPECNSTGLALMEPLPLTGAFRAVHEGRADTVIVLENDLYLRAEADAVNAFFSAARDVVALDQLTNRTTTVAEVVLPAGTLAETGGTLVSYEGRAQRFFQALVPAGNVRASWRWLGSDLRPEQGVNGSSLRTVDEIVLAIGEKIPALAAIEYAAPLKPQLGKVAREPHRCSGRTSILANISVHEPKPPDDPDSGLAFSMESGPAAPPPPVLPFFWSPGWNSIQSVNKFQAEIGGHLRGGDPGIRLIEPSAEGWAYFFNLPDAFQAEPGNLLLLPCFHIFGSEELSRYAPGIAQLEPRPYIALNATDGALLGLKSQEPAYLGISNSVHELLVLLRSDVPRGVALIPTLKGYVSSGRGKITLAAREAYKAPGPATMVYGLAR
jgi:NADH-quinone oxidoreductase subunit G